MQLIITMPIHKYKNILISHGAGGRLTHELIESLFLRNFYNEKLAKLEDAASLRVNSSRVAFTTDAFVVKPIFFPGGDIGKLAVCGTINDLAMKAAKPIAISTAFIIEEGFDMEKLEVIVDSIKTTAMEAKVEVVCGDTKVVEKSSADGIFIVTSGIGLIQTDYEVSYSNARVSDVIIISGTIADHGAAVLVARESYNFETNIHSDCAPLWEPIRMLIESIPEIHVLKDPTRGGLATSLNEIALASKKQLVINEVDIPIKKDVLAACDVLGIDPLYLASEGRFICILPEKYAQSAISVLKEHPLTRNAKIIGYVNEGSPSVKMITKICGERLIRMLEGEPLPRIC
ncbi:MAG: hydrogenase expression/formation protein HypE [bacterium]|nr:hydrogenase expression/formation protein HypE [bacterium]